MDSRHRLANNAPNQSFHEGFVELEELVSCNNELVWKERARWIKLEEDVEECANRWGKPHIPCLTFHSLREVERNLQNGVFLLDLKSGDLPSICEVIIDQFKSLQKLPDEECEAVKAVLLTRHEHQYQKRKHPAKTLARRLSRIMPHPQRPRRPSIAQKSRLTAVAENTHSSGTKCGNENDPM